MKKLTIPQIAVLTASLILLPAIGFTAQKAATSAPMTGKSAAVAACEGKMVGDKVSLTMKGKHVEAACQDVKGTLKAVVPTHK
jgi:hypothetical protein